MAIFKCKMCGGALEVTDGVTVCECEYCGTKQTLPKLNDEKKTNLYDRANHFRRNNEFDKAMSIYEQILNEDTSDAEAYWSLVLCKYGIEYVDDPATHKKVPTVNRAQFTSIFADEDYKSAIANADVYQKSVYEDEAKAIDEIQKGILAISEKEEPFDVFICYKETDNNGRRTPDSVLATELYNELTREGFKVFFARITLEDKLGTAYEPYIFSALNSAKIMLVVGTDYEYLNAVWVKNEWSRFLKLIAKDKSKVLIPCYQNMDPYDMPDEFKSLQSQDCSKLGFMQDLVRGIDKLFGKTNEPTSVSTQTVVSSGPQVSSLLERAFMFLEDRAWDSADEYAEKVLDIDPKNGNAYLIKLLVDLELTSESSLESLNEPFDDNANYEKACRFDDALKSRLNSYITTINERNEKAYQEKIPKLNKLDKLVEYAKAHDDSFENRINSQLNKLANEKTEFQKQKSDLENALANALAKIANIKSENDSLVAYLKAYESERAGLGIFAGSKKRELDSKISAVKLKLTENEETLIKLNSMISAGTTVESIASKIAEIERNITKLQNELIEFNNREQSNENIDDLINILSDEVIVKYLKDNNEVLLELKSNKKIAFKLYEIGLISLKFGTYANGEIEWQVHAKEDDRVLIITKNIIDSKEYNTERTDITWESRTLRKWLNNDFYNNAFSEDEKALIQTTNVVNMDNARFGTKGGNDTKDKVFLLSIDEANQYFTNDSERECEGTWYCSYKDLYVAGNGNSLWWLRSPGDEQNSAARVSEVGDVELCEFVDIDCIGVRPALWINSLIINQKINK